MSTIFSAVVTTPSFAVPRIAGALALAADGVGGDQNYFSQIAAFAFLHSPHSIFLSRDGDESPESRLDLDGRIEPAQYPVSSLSHNDPTFSGMFRLAIAG